MFHDILRETWVSQELLQEGEEKGLKKAPLVNGGCAGSL
jgi:hypothetical protein